MAEQEQQPEDNTNQPVAAKPQSGSNKTIIFIVIFAIVLSLLPGVAYAGIFFSLYKSLIRDPAPNTLSQAGQVNCSGWSVTFPDYQTSIQTAAQKFGINPALLGAIFMSENGDSWPSKDISEMTWGNSAKGAQGPFQFMPDTWAGLVRGQSAFNGYSVQNFQQAAEVSAFHLKGILDTYHWSLTSPTGQQVACVAAAYNGGGSLCKDWEKNNTFTGTEPTTDDNNYHTRAQQNYDVLNTSCSAAVGASDNKIVQVAAKELASSDAACSKYTTESCYIKWCAYFDSWVYKQAGYNIPSIGGAAALKDWFESNGHTVTPTPKASDIQPGDLMFVGTSGKITHTGVVQNVVGNYVYTIEGNARGKPGQVKSEKRMAQNIMFIARW